MKMRLQKMARALFQMNVGRISPLLPIPFIQQSNNPTIQQSNNPTIQQSNNPTIQQSNNPTIQQSNNPTIQQSTNPFIQACFPNKSNCAATSLTGSLFPRCSTRSSPTAAPSPFAR